MAWMPPQLMVQSGREMSVQAGGYEQVVTQGESILLGGRTIVAGLVHDLFG
jgi:hypothetical protein